MNPFEVLEISPGATPEEIKAAYHGMAKKWHPDRFSGESKAEAEVRFRMLAEAYNMLKDLPAVERPAEIPAPAPPVPAPAPEKVFQEPPEIIPEPRPAALKTAREWYQEAKDAAETKNFDQALGLVQYAIRLDATRAEFHALHGRMLEATGGDKRIQVQALEDALRLNPKDLDTTILLAQTFESLGMHARAGRLWQVAQGLGPKPPAGAPARGGKPGAGKARGGSAPGLGERWAFLVARVRAALDRILRRG